jgi:hypothetical protein
MTADRITIGLGQTLQIKRFEPIRLDVTMESDVMPDETVEQALMRVEDVVDTKLAEMIKEAVENPDSE